MTALEDQLNGDASTSLDVDFISETDLPPDPDFNWFTDESVSESETADSRKRGSLKSDTPDPVDRDAKGGIPNIDEWMNFFSNVAIRLLTDFYIDVAFRDVDENLLTERDIDRIHLGQHERDRIARPFAEFSNKSKFMRKRGRMIMASADSIDAAIQLGMWFTRVNRIASRYKGTHRKAPKVTPVRASPIWRSEPEPVPDMTDRSSDSVSPQQDQGTRTGVGAFRPRVGGPVFNPSGGG